LQDKLDALKEEISKLGNLQVMYSNSIDFGGYDYSGNPNLMANINADSFSQGSGALSVVDDGDEVVITLDPNHKLEVLKPKSQPALLTGKTYTVSVEIMLEGDFTGDPSKIGLRYIKMPNWVSELYTRNTLTATKGVWQKLTGTVKITAASDNAESWLIMLQNKDANNSLSGKLRLRHAKLEEGSTATPYQPNLLDAPYYLSKVALGENLVTNAKFPIITPNNPISGFDISEELIIGETYTVSLKGTKPANKEFHLYYGDANYQQSQSQYQATLLPVEGLANVWSATFTARNTSEMTNLLRVALWQKPNSATYDTVQIDWLKIEKGKTRTPNISEYKYRGIGMRDSNNPYDYVWDIEPEYVEENLATESKVTEIIGEANKYTDNSIEAVNINVTNIADDLAKQINVNENAARNYTDTKKIEAVNESKKYTDEVFRKEIVNLTVKNGNLGTARLYRQGNCVTIYFFDLNGRNSGGNDSVILTVPEGYRPPISFEQLVGSTDRSAFNNAQLGFGADGNIYWRRNTSYASSYTFTVTYII
uniref:DUF2479 domain-containing protein n=1 Tax=Enterococcus faecium TaxID=1352 RepID=UPI001897D81C